jgi:uncharacterized membrane protein
VRWNRWRNIAITLIDPGQFFNECKRLFTSTNKTSQGFMEEVLGQPLGLRSDEWYFFQMSRGSPLVLSFFVFAVAFCCLRFVRLEQKLYWVDEVATSEHITPDIADQIESGLESGDIKNAGQVASLMELSKPATLSGTVVDLVASDPHHTPPYYLLLNLWSRLFGLEPGKLRLLSAVFSLAAVPALYWLALELFQSPLIAAISVWLYALSPFELIYAQQAREYSMWILLILLSSASLVCAARRPRLTSWLLYFLFTSTMLWTHLLSIWIVIAHSAFMAIHFRGSRKTIISFGSVVALSVLLLGPWLIMVGTRQAELNDFSGIGNKVAPSLYVETFLLNLSRTVLDTDLPSYEHLPYFQWRLIVPIAATVLLIASCVWLFIRRATSELRTLLCLLSVCTMLPLVLADVVAGGRRALLPRYDSPTWISLDLILAFSIVHALSTQRKLNLWAGRAAMVLILCCGSFSQGKFLSRTTWWTTRPPDLARSAVVLAGNPNVALGVDLSSFHTGQVISLAYFLRERPIIAIKDQSVPMYSGEALVYRPSDELIRNIEESHRFLTRQETGYLWRLSPLQP